MANVSHPNRILASLTAAEYGRLKPHLKLEPLNQGTVILDAGETMTRLIFPHTGVISLVVGLASGEMVETGMIGRDGLLGGAALLDADMSLSRAVVQIAGAASVVDTDVFRKVVDLGPSLRAMLFRHEQTALLQAQQSAACNASHALEGRLSRWLLRCRDLMTSDELQLTQEFLGQMLGVQRSSVSITASALQEAGVMRYRRGHIRILDVKALKENSCECYQTVKTLSDRLVGPRKLTN